MNNVWDVISFVATVNVTFFDSSAIVSDRHPGKNTYSRLELVRLYWRLSSAVPDELLSITLQLIPLTKSNLLEFNLLILKNPQENGTRTHSLFLFNKSGRVHILIELCNKWTLTSNPLGKIEKYFECSTLGTKVCGRLIILKTNDGKVA